MVIGALRNFANECFLMQVKELSTNYRFISFRGDKIGRVVVSDERTIAKTVGLSLTVVFVAILILSAISY
jgi:hypothetical protein